MSTEIRPGATFGDYRVEELVGRGGMGVVYRATDLSLERPAALKLIGPELAQNEHFRSRFLEEPRLAASLDHPMRAGLPDLFQGAVLDRVMTVPDSLGG